MTAELPLETWWESHPLLFLFQSQVYVASLAATKPAKKQWLGFLVSRFYGPARDWAEQLARSGSSALYDVTYFSERSLKEFLQPGQSNCLDVLERGIKVLDKEDWPFHLYYAWLDRIEAAALLQVPVDVVERTSSCMSEGCRRETKHQCKNRGLQEAFYCSNECFKSSWREHKQLHRTARAEIQSEVNLAGSELKLETYVEVSAVELQTEVNMATSELRPETYSEVSSAKEVVPLSSPAEEAILLPCTAEEAVLLSSPAEEAILLPCTAEEAVLLSSPAEEAVLPSSPAEEAVLVSSPEEEAVLLPCPTEEAVLLSSPTEDIPLPSCTAEYAILFDYSAEDGIPFACPTEYSALFTCAEEDVSLLSCFAEEAAQPSSPAEDAAQPSSPAKKPPSLSAQLGKPP